MRPVSRSNGLLRNPRRVDRLLVAKRARGPDPKARPSPQTDPSSFAQSGQAERGRSARSRVRRIREREVVFSGGILAQSASGYERIHRRTCSAFSSGGNTG